VGVTRASFDERLGLWYIDLALVGSCVFRRRSGKRILDEVHDHVSFHIEKYEIPSFEPVFQLDG